MNRLYTEMTPEVSWFRHNWGFHDVSDWTGAMPHDFEWAPYVVPGLRVDRSFRPGDTALYASDTKADLGAIEAKSKQRATVLEVEPPEVGTLGASGKPTDKQGVTIQLEDGTMVTTVMSCLSADTGEEAESTDASGQSDTPTPPELGVWDRVVAGGDEYIKENMMHHIGARNEDKPVVCFQSDFIVS